jgi:hypothetical protein
MLKPFDKDTLWPCYGIIAKGNITLLSALWKAGKTTWLSHLLSSLGSGEAFCGLEVLPSRVLYVPEESEGMWEQRKHRLDLQDNVSFIIRPFKTKPDFPTWLEFLDYVKGLCTGPRPDRNGVWKPGPPFDLVIFDTLSNLWPVRDENDAAQVQAALMPLRGLTDTGASLLLAHHLNKGDSTEGRGSRGSGALPGFVDIILELRRSNAADWSDRKRVLTGYSRFEETPRELVIELTQDGAAYISHGNRQQAGKEERLQAIRAILPANAPGLTLEEIQEALPTDPQACQKDAIERIARGREPRALEEGRGRQTGRPIPLLAGMSFYSPLGCSYRG